MIDRCQIPRGTDDIAYTNMKEAQEVLFIPTLDEFCICNTATGITQFRSHNNGSCYVVFFLFSGKSVGTRIYTMVYDEGTHLYVVDLAG